jgi:hypothetical protein
MTDQDANPLDSCDSGEFPTDLLSTATIPQIRGALDGEQALIALLRQQSRQPGSSADEEFRSRLQRATQLRNALSQAESTFFWEALRHGCADEVGEECDPAIRHADARYYEWDASRKGAFEKQFSDAMQADMSPSGRVLRAIEITEATQLEAVKQRINVYATVSDELKRDSMLSPESLDRLACRILRNVGFAFIWLRVRIARYFASAGWSDAEPSIDWYLHPAMRVRDAVYRALAVLQTKYEATHLQESTPESHKPKSTGQTDDLVGLDHILDGQVEVDMRTAARYLGRSIDHVRRLVRTGKIAATRKLRPKMLDAGSVRRYRRS